MNYEKEYNEALKRAKRFYDSNTNEGYRQIFEEIFPELTENEDERIRKELIELVEEIRSTTYYGRCCYKEIPFKSILAWLEKQGEYAKFKDSIQVNDKVTRNQDGVLVNLSQLNRVAKKDEKQGAQKSKKESLWKHWKDDIARNGGGKPADKVKPKFKIGDWVVTSYGKVNQVVSVDKDVNGYILDDGVYFSGSWCDMYHLWTIQDAKDGDVLYCKNSGIEYIVMSKGVNESGNIDSYFRYNSLNGFDVDVPSVLSSRQDDITPANKEQHDFLFQKMKEAEYEWDAEKKELKKIEQTTTNNQFTPEQASVLDKHIDKFLGQKPAWSEEDEKMLSLIIARLHSHPHVEAEEYGKDYHFLKSLKGRVQPQQEWSETEEIMLGNILAIIKVQSKEPKENKELLCSFLKSLRPQNGYAYNPYKAVVESIAAMVEKYAPFDSNLQDFYDNVKVKCKDAKEYDSLYPQSTWKPSDEQMDALHYVTNFDYGGHKATLVSLYEQLKKLK